MSLQTYTLETGQNAWFFGTEQEKTNFIIKHNDSKKIKILTASTDYFNAPFYAQLSPTKRYHDSIKALRTLKLIEKTNRYATKKEQGILAKFSSFASTPQIFDFQNTKFKSKREELLNLVDSDEFNSLRLATLSAFYTPQSIINGLSSAIKKSGFKSGSVLEPASGTGTLIQALGSKSYLDSDITMIELDSISSRINYTLYPHAKLYQNTGFENANIENDSQDIIIANPPFGSAKITDLARPSLNGLTLHNYFLNRSIDCLKEGGLFYTIVSTSFLNSKNNKNRQAIAKKATLLHAIRLPKNLFEKHTGANASVDILLFKKENNTDESPSWLNSIDTTCPVTQEDFYTNNYFLESPQFQLGQMQVTGTFQGNSTHCVYNETDIDSKIKDLFDTFPSQCFSAKKAKQTTNTLKTTDIDQNDIVTNLTNLNSHAFVFDKQNNLYTLNSNDENNLKFNLVDNAKGLIKERIFGMCEIRDVLLQLLHAEKNDHTNLLNDLRTQLNKNYDAFINKYGYLTQGANQRVFKQDPYYANLLSLEVDFKDVKKNKNKTITCKATANKALIFSQRVISPYIPPTSASNIVDALHISINETGKVDLDRISSLFNKDIDSCILALQNYIYLDPKNNEYLPTNLYLSGDVKTKLAQAKKAALKNTAFDKNVNALEKIIPADVAPCDISLRCHSAWLPHDVVADFISHILGDNIRTTISHDIGKWSLKINGFVPDTINHTEFGTKDFSAIKTIESLFMGRDLVVKISLGEGKYRVDHDQTVMVQSNVQKIHDNFKQWVFNDQKRTQTLSKRYNDKFNREVCTNYDADFLKIPSLSSNVTPYKHQKRAIYRGITQGCLLVDLPVGAGKSLVLASITEMMLSLGIKKKALLVTKNHLVHALGAEYLRLFPGANILCLTPDDLSVQKRENTLLRLKTNAVSVVIIPETTLNKLPIPASYEKQFIEEDIAEIISAKERLKTKRFSIKKLETMEENLKWKLLTLSNNVNKNTQLDLESLGIDLISVDEVHSYKNLFYNSNLARKCAGLNTPTGSKKAYDLYLKTRYLTEKSIENNTSKGLVFATGTVLSNSLIEIFVFKRYLMREKLIELNISHLDEWLGLYGESSDSFELSPTGKGFKLTQRLRKFTNLPEMLKIYNSIAEVVLEADLDALLPKLPCGSPSRPPMRTGKAQTEYVEPSPLQENFMSWLVFRAKNFKNDQVTNDNMLLLMWHAKASSLDLRLLNPSVKANPNRKAVKCADNAIRLYNEYHQQKGTQLIFCDLGVPKKQLIALKQKIDLLESIIQADNGDSVKAQEELDNIDFQQRMLAESNFDVYNDIKQLLINRGIPENEIVFAQDFKSPAEKLELHSSLNDGTYRVVIASTASLGSGANVNAKLIGMHLIDPVFRPSDNTQRIGRAIRVGNKIYTNNPQSFKGVDIIYYATLRSLDAFLYQMLSLKATFIESFKKASKLNDVRTVEDIGSDTLTFEQLKTETSGDPLVKEHFELTQSVNMLEIKFNQWQKAQISTNLFLERAKIQKESTIKKLILCKMDLKTSQKNTMPKGKFLLTDHLDNNITAFSKGSNYINQLVLSKAKDVKNLTYSQAIELPIFKYNGFEISIELYQDTIEISMIGKLTYAFSRNYQNFNASGILLVLNNYNKDFEKQFVEGYNTTIRHCDAELQTKKQNAFDLLDELNLNKQKLNDISKELAKKETNKVDLVTNPPLFIQGLTNTGNALVSC